jgi:microcystin-dependent protein
VVVEFDLTAAARLQRNTLLLSEHRPLNRRRYKVSEPYLGEIRPVGFTFAPVGWAFCNGATLPISQNTALFSLLGTTYGGNGVTTFQLPNLSGCAAISFGQSVDTSNYTQGQVGGVETVQLTANQIPVHSHAIVAQGSEGSVASPVGAYFAASSVDQYAPSAAGVTGPILTIAGSSQVHTNLQPYLVINYIIALQGIFPSRN